MEDAVVEVMLRNVTSRVGVAARGSGQQVAQHRGPRSCRDGVHGLLPVLPVGEFVVSFDGDADGSKRLDFRRLD